MAKDEKVAIAIQPYIPTHAFKAKKFAFAAWNRHGGEALEDDLSQAVERRTLDATL